MGKTARALGAALDLLLPPRCLGCGGAVGQAGGLCARCWDALRFIDAPVCRCCGLGLEEALGRPDGGQEGGAEGAPGGGDPLCAACLTQAPAFDRLRSALVYDDASRPLILAFKHADRTALAPLFAAWMARAGAEMLRDADVLVPVPLHRWRLWRRRYNQAALLCHALARSPLVRSAADGGVRVAAGLLARRRATRAQGRLSAKGRARNVKGAIHLATGQVAGLAAGAGDVRGLRVVLIDDVYTTGATVTECVRVLRRAGAARVDVLTLARVPLVR